MFDASLEIEILKNTTSSILIYNDKPDEQCLYLDTIVSPERGSGFGSKVMKCLVQLSYEKGYDGNISLDAAYSAHIFYLYMGMVPKDVILDYVMNKYGYTGKAALFTLNQFTDIQDLYEKNPHYMGILIKMLAIEKKRQPEAITMEDVSKERKFLSSLLEKKMSYLKNQFIPLFLKLLKEQTGEKYPDTYALDTVPMTMSEEGKARWLKAITDDTDFEPFKNFEHLKTLMTEAQGIELDNILLEGQMKINQRMEYLNQSIEIESTYPNSTDIQNSNRSQVTIKVTHSITGFGFFTQKYSETTLDERAKTTSCVIL